MSNTVNVLTIKEWKDKYVAGWKPVINSDTETVEGGYLFLRQDDGTVIGKQTRNVSNRKQAIEFHYGRYLSSLVPPEKTLAQRLSEIA